MEGYLLKWTNYVFGWQRRYFILHDGVLHYCKEKGSSKRGAIHLDISNVFKHPRNPLRFYIDTGCTSVHLKAFTVSEAEDWYWAIRREQSDRTDAPRQNTQEIPISEIISGKIGEMWSVHAEIQAAIDLIPSNMKKHVPGLDKIINLTEQMKIIGSETLGIIEDAEKNHLKLWNEPPEGDGVEFAKVQKERVEAGYDIGIDDDTIDFVDAQSHISEKIEEVEVNLLVPNDLMPHRSCLPVLRNPRQKMNIWKVIKDSIGLELSRIAVPVYFNEPLSFLQRFSEDLTYTETLVKAAICPDSCMRLAYVACFAISSYASNENRTMKPFNPLLGETYELQRDGFNLISEQVSHHPPVSAIHVDHEKYWFSGMTQVKTAFKGTYLVVSPSGTFHVGLKQYNDHFIWQKPLSNVHNIIMGKIYLEHYGTVEMSNITTGDKAIIELKKAGWFERPSGEVSGSILDANGVEKYKIYGKYNEGMNIIEPITGDTTVAWKLYPNPDAFEHSYYFSDFALQLNLPPELVPGIAPTDSRLRPDQRALENGDIKFAGSEKFRLEEKQRAARKALEETGEIYHPKWFELHNDEWVYSGGYWEDKAKGCFTGCPDIF